MTVEEAIATLEAAGFVCEKLAGDDGRPRILGGTARAQGTEDAYVGAFSIHQDGAGWRLVWSGGGRGQGEDAGDVGTLDAAVAAACTRLS